MSAPRSAARARTTLVVRYEDLQADLPRELVRLADFLALPGAVLDWLPADPGARAHALAMGVTVVRPSTRRRSRRRTGSRRGASRRDRCPDGEEALASGRLLRRVALPRRDGRPGLSAGALYTGPRPAPPRPRRRDRAPRASPACGPLAAASTEAGSRAERAAPLAPPHTASSGDHPVVDEEDRDVDDGRGDEQSGPQLAPDQAVSPLQDRDEGEERGLGEEALALGSPRPARPCANPDARIPAAHNPRARRRTPDRSAPD